jgi:putative toxin-antitoxin system antitoxin component (TIGR02293 family)
MKDPLKERKTSPSREETPPETNPPGIDDLFTLVTTALAGVEASLVSKVAKDLLIQQEEIAQILHVSSKTLRNYEMERKKLNPTTSEQVLKLQRMADKGKEVFGDPKAFLRWLQTPAYGLEHQIPMQLLQTSGGIDLIIEELDRIAYGDFS